MGTARSIGTTARVAAARADVGLQPQPRPVVCGVRVEDVADTLMQKIRYLDKLIDELARGKPMASILLEHAATARASKAPN